MSINIIHSGAFEPLTEITSFTTKGAVNVCLNENALPQVAKQMPERINSLYDIYLLHHR